MTQKYNEVMMGKYIEDTLASMAIPEFMKEDAVQEAWVAALEGKDIKKAVGRFVSAESQYSKHKKASL